ncbi:hypothetical protein HYX01_02885 [Candidatus Woesearchaeota archaeon]|nr:hypothetical protein [Candidatus Woesearchaeota archaeon]
MVKLQCRKCNFQFDKPKIPRRCPYCGKSNTILPYKTAQNYIDEVET